MTRTVLLVTHTGREEARQVAAKVIDKLGDAGVAVRVMADERHDIPIPEADARVASVVAEGDPLAAEGCELIVVIGGDGTILRGAEVARPTGTPILGVNLGHVGFLAESEVDDLGYTVDHIVKRDYTVEERMTIDVSVRHDGTEIATGWALNEVSVEKASRERMLDVVAEIDGRALSRWGCDGVVMATPTGSTAYAFSAGGPVVWPEVAALLMVPISAHALFARPLVVSPSSSMAVTIQHRTPGAVLWCDGRRAVELPAGARIEVCRGAQPVRLARLHEAPFTKRLVAKFALPVEGWRGARPRPPGSAHPEHPA
ncbi:NAD kinase [Jiangella ureilytica]|uniref:NAD kinase n=1 Tax=Jiangella ureilytica TaxID=2530374 RepID=A0A4R4RH36_9ACTN|nr:NAD kinase [Jiangella ureilytica]TDC48566.1 NAD kinase [Jiangella ureilytica]